MPSSIWVEFHPEMGRGAQQSGTGSDLGLDSHPRVPWADPEHHVIWSEDLDPVHGCSPGVRHAGSSVEIWCLGWAPGVSASGGPRGSRGAEALCLSRSVSLVSVTSAHVVDPLPSASTLLTPLSSAPAMTCSASRCGAARRPLARRTPTWTPP